MMPKSSSQSSFNTPVNVKLNMAQLQEKLEKQEAVIKLLSEENLKKDNLISDLCKKVTEMQRSMIFNESLRIVQDRVNDELRKQLTDLQQYTRRYSVVVSGIKKNIPNEKEEIKGILGSSESGISMKDVDKFHRIEPTHEDNEQDKILRFKSHSAKEAFFNCRKNIRRGIKVKPSLTPDRRKLLKEADYFIKTNSIGTSLKIEPEYVFADIHGNLKVKMKKEGRGKRYFKFSTLSELRELIDKNNMSLNENLFSSFS